MIKRINTKINEKSVGKHVENGFMSGVFILSLSTVVVKIIGLACKIPLISILGAEGMGYFNSAYEIYALLCVISTAGLPVALSMLVSARREREDSAGIRGIWRTALLLFVGLGVIGSLVLSFGADKIAALIGNADAAASLVAIAPALLCVCISSAVRGYFQGFGNMTPTAISQLIEALGKLAFGVSFAIVAINNGADIRVASAYSVLGITVGTLLSSFYLMILKLKDKPIPTVSGEIVNTEKRGGYMRTLLKIAFPITLSSAVLSVTRMIDTALILHRLGDIGLGTVEINEIYGSYTTLALPVFSLVPSLITPIALSLVPQLSASIEKRSGERQTRVLTDSMRLTVLFSMPSSMGIALYARPILSILFAGESKAIDIAAPLLSTLGASVLFSCVITTTNAILQSYRKTVLPIISMVVGSVVKIFSAYMLIGVEDVGVMGAPISTFLCNLCITAMNIYFISGFSREKSVFKVFGKPFAASVLAMLLSLSVYIPIRLLADSEIIAFLTALPIATVGYFAFAILVRAFVKEDLALLPFLKNKEKNLFKE